MLQFPIHSAFRLTSKFGARKDPFTGAYSGHNGTDFAIPVNTPLYSPASGTITSSFTNSAGGNQVVITHNNGIKTGYAHLNSKFPKGTKLKKNELFAYSGNTGRSTGPHLHLTVKKNDNLIDPLSIRWQLKPGQQLNAPKELKTTKGGGLLLGVITISAISLGAYYTLKDK
jgi:murein DD-endopeptidase